MLRYFQIHLDFHTSGEIRGIGAEFSQAYFQDALKAGHVDSITVFSQCHHGISYHDTQVRHPPPAPRETAPAPHARGDWRNQRENEPAPGLVAAAQEHTGTATCCS
jgi:hypothetical protein